MRAVKRNKKETGIKLGEFLSDRRGQLLGHLLSMAALSLFLYLTGTAQGLLVILLAVWALGLAVHLLVKYVNLNAHLQEMEAVMEGLDQKYLFTECIAKPAGLYERSLFSLMRRSGKAMLEAVSEAQAEQREYQEYIEDWVHEIKAPITAAQLICHAHKQGARLACDVRETDIKLARSRREAGYLGDRQKASGDIQAVCPVHKAGYRGDRQKASGHIQAVCPVHKGGWLGDRQKSLGHIQAVCPVYQAGEKAGSGGQAELLRKLTGLLPQIEEHVERVLYYARAGSVEKDLIVRETSLSELVRDALARHRDLLIQNGAVIKTDGLDAVVYTDSKWVAFMLGQLLSNAVRYKRDALVIRFEASSYDSTAASGGAAGHLTDKKVYRNDSEAITSDEAYLNGSEADTSDEAYLNGNEAAAGDAAYQGSSKAAAGAVYLAGQEAYLGGEAIFSDAACAGGETIRLTITDNGLGIAAEELPRIFERGFTGRNGRARGKSTGMGLYICRKLADFLQIRLAVRSKEGEFTAIDMTFPAKASLMSTDQSNRQEFRRQDIHKRALNRRK